MQQTLAALENLIWDFESGGKHHKDASQGAGLLGVLAWPLSALLGLFWSS